MNENRNAADFAGGAATPRGCERAEDFVTYLYGEASPGESKAFRLHLEACAVCREEFAALGGVREAFGAWRAEAFGSIPSLDFGDALTPAFARPAVAERRRSASAALREFFTLAPVWLRAGAFAAALAVCVLTALTLARAEVRWDADGLAFRTGVSERVVSEQVPAPPPVAVPTPPAQVGYTEEQVEAIVAQRIAEAEAQLRKQTTTPRVVNASAAPVRNQPASDAQRPRERKRAPRPAARRDEPLLADDNLPRLSDLLGGSY